MFNGEVVSSRLLGYFSTSDGALSATAQAVHTRWCYGIEKYLYILKKIVRNESKPEGSIPVGYAYDNALGFCTEYLLDFQHTSCRIWNAEEDRDTKEVLEETGKDVLFLYNMQTYTIFMTMTLFVSIRLRTHEVHASK